MAGARAPGRRGKAGQSWRRAAPESIDGGAEDNGEEGAASEGHVGEPKGIGQP